MGLTNTHLLLSVNLLHFFSAGLVAPVLTPHITSNGGSHVGLGVLVAAIFLCNKISTQFKTIFEKTKFSLTFSLFSSFFTYLLLVFFSNCWIICMARCLYELTNQVSSLSKEYASRNHPKDQQIKIFNLIDVTKVAGMVLGSISGGYIFDHFEDFGAVAMVATILTFLGILSLQYMDDENFVAPKQQKPHHQNSPKLDIAKNWDRILVKTTYTSAFVVYFSRFAFLISSNYEVGIIIIGYSVAYQHMLKFACDCLVPLIRDRVKNKKCLFEHSLVLCGFTLCGLCYAPTYELYLILFVPMIFTHTLINSLLEEDVLELKSTQAEETIDDLVSISAPVAFGIACQIFGTQAFKTLALLPLVTCVYLLNQRVLPFKKEEDKTKEE